MLYSRYFTKKNRNEWAHKKLTFQFIYVFNFFFSRNKNHLNENNCCRVQLNFNIFVLFMIFLLCLSPSSRNAPCVKGRVWVLKGELWRPWLKPVWASFFLFCCRFLCGIFPTCFTQFGFSSFLLGIISTQQLAM